MDKYNLQPNESFVLSSEHVSHNDSNGELMLTNINLVYIITKGVFKTVYITQQYPINQIKIFEGTPQIIMGKDGNIDIYFIDGKKSFKFWNNETFFSEKKAEKEALKWINAINQLLTGHVPVINSSGVSTSDTEFVAETIKETFDSFKGALGLKSKTQSTNISEKVAKKCASCGAPISGIKGEIVRCQYCDSDQQL